MLFDDLAAQAGAEKQKSNEWYTPARYVDAARQVMGGIDLDPASTELANMTVRAARYYTIEDNGLTLPWYGRVWLNPPYSAPDGTLGRLGSKPGSLKPFIMRLIAEYHAGRVEQAVLLVNSDSDATWFIPLWEFLICFADHKVMFHRPGKPNEGQFFGTVFAYMGQNESAFIDIFSEFGAVARAVARPRRSRATAAQAAAPISLWGDI